MSGKKIAESQALVFRSKLLLLNSANSSYQRTHEERDLKRARHFRVEMVLRTTELDRVTFGKADSWLPIYAALIDRAASALRGMRSTMSTREGPERFEVATDIQMLEELIAQWRSRMQVIEETAADS